MSNNKDAYFVEEYNPQSRFDNLQDIEPEFWKRKSLEQMNKSLKFLCRSY